MRGIARGNITDIEVASSIVAGLELGGMDLFFGGDWPDENEVDPMVKGTYSVGQINTLSNR